MIQKIREGGPMDLNECLSVGDELLEVNGQTLVGVSHDEAIELVRQAPNDVTIVVCRMRNKDDRMKETPSITSSKYICIYMSNVLSLSLSLSLSPHLLTLASGTPELPMTIEIQQPTTSESEDDHGSTTTSLTSASPALQAIYQMPDFSRRFERQSWRERHEEERRR